jgi:hypothetical protein
MFGKSKPQPPLQVFEFSDRLDALIGAGRAAGIDQRTISPARSIVEQRPCGCP